MLGEIRSLRFESRLNAISGVVLCPKINGKCRSMWASSVRVSAFRILGMAFLILGEYVTTNGIPILLGN